MPRLTEKEFLEIQHRMQRTDRPSPDHFMDTEADDSPESVLQSKIKDNCKQKGWPCLCFPQTPAVRKFLPPGWPDIAIKLPFGQTLEIETKGEGGRLSDNQKLMKAMFTQLGHTIHKVNSYKGYLQLIEKVMRGE